MSYLAKEQLIHGNLNGSNVVLHRIEGKIVPRITDFDVNYFVEQPYHADFSKWHAPETFVPHGIAVSASDVWSFGVFLNELFNLAAVPFPGLGNADIKGYLGEKQDVFRFLNSDHIIKEINDMIAMCLKYEPHERPTWETLLALLAAVPDVDHTIRLATEYLPSGLYTGFYSFAENLVPKDEAFNKMSYTLVSEKGNIQGSGFDGPGQFGISGSSTGIISGTSVVTLTKQYKTAHTVKYDGTYDKQAQAIAGKWNINGRFGGAFILKRKY